MRFTFTITAILLIGACAPRPQNIAAVDIGQNEYRAFSCTQLDDAEVQYDQALKNLSAEQNRAATGDAWGVFLIGLPISSMAGTDKETAIAVTKGKLQAIERQQRRRDCS